VALLAPCAKSRCVLDEALLDTVAPDVVSAFTVRHKGHTCVVFEDGASPALRQQYDLVSSLGLECITYASLVRAIVYGDVAKLERFAGKIMPLAPMHSVHPPPTGTNHHPIPRDTTPGQPLCTFKAVPLIAPLQLPDFPCFAQVEGSTSGRKRFQKQPLFKAGIHIKCEEARPVLQVDLVVDDLVPSQVTRPATRTHYVAPVVIPHEGKRPRTHSPSTTKRTKKSLASGGAGTTTTTAQTTATTAPPARGGKPLDIFDIDFEMQ
jgi:hypothetical protein